MKDLIINEQSPIYKIFYYPFHCRVPKYSTISYDEIERYGVYKTIDSDSTAYEPIDKILTINEMVDLFKNGVSLELAKPKESGKIYEIILDHLKMWRDYGLNFGVPYEPPLEDLYLLDELAKAIYITAMTYGNRKEKEEDLFDLMEGLVPLTDDDLYFDHKHEDVIGEIQALKDKLGEYKRYGY